MQRATKKLGYPNLIESWILPSYIKWVMTNLDVQVQRQANVFQAVKVAFKNEFVKKGGFLSQSFFEQKLTLALNVIRYIGNNENIDIV